MNLYNIEKNINTSNKVLKTKDKLFNSFSNALDNLENKTALIGNYQYEYSFLTIQTFKFIKGEPLSLDSIKVIRLKKFGLSEFNLFSGKHSGDVQDFEYENEIETNDRTCFANFVNKDLFREFKNKCNETGIIINDIQTEQDYLYYSNTFKSNRKRNIYKVNFTIPKGISALPVWQILESNTKHLTSKKLKASSL